MLATLLVRAIAAGHRWEATILDFAVLAVAAIGYQIWALNDHDIRVLLVEALGSACGTFLALSL